MTQIQLQGEQDTETHFFLLIPHLTRKRTPQGDVAGSIYDTTAKSVMGHSAVWEST